MFNRGNISKRQFHLTDDLDPAPPTGRGVPKRSGDGFRFPMAGGEFIADESIQPNPSDVNGRADERSGMARGRFITQSAQTVLPGQAQWNTYGDDTLHKGTAFEGQRFVAFGASGESADPTQQLAGWNNQIDIDSGYAADGPGHSTVSGRLAQGDGRTHGVVPDHEVGEEVRRLQAKNAEQRIEEDGGREGFTVREFNALHEDPDTRWLVDPRDPDYPKER